ncbi:MAG: hypothetical protein RLZZ214_393 [Verrucomicrobiota bacterium]|jgi:hypothetical protein
MNAPKITAIGPTPPDYGLPTLPSLGDLVTVAAQISSSEEDPADTAYRALCLFTECRTALVRARRAASTVRFEEYAASEKRKMDEEFIEVLDACDGDSSSAVTLDSFLIACESGTKPTTRISKWRGFTRAYVEKREIIDVHQGESKLHDSELKAAAAEMANFYEVKGIGREVVLTARDLFSEWLIDDKMSAVEERAAKSKRAKIYLPVCRKVLQKEPMTDSECETLKGMTTDEVASAIETLRSKNELGENGAGMLIAALTDARLPKSAKPRVAKKIPKV